MKPHPIRSWSYFLTLGLPLKARILLGTLVPVIAVLVYFAETFVAQKQFAVMTHQILDERIVMMESASQIKEALVSVG